MGEPDVVAAGAAGNVFFLVIRVVIGRGEGKIVVVQLGRVPVIKIELVAGRHHERHGGKASGRARVPAVGDFNVFPVALGAGRAGIGAVELGIGEQTAVDVKIVSVDVLHFGVLMHFGQGLGEDRRGQDGKRHQRCKQQCKKFALIHVVPPLV